MEMIGFRIPQDRYDELTQYREDRDISESEAIRRLVRIGLEEEKRGPFAGNVDPFAFGIGVAGAAGLIAWIAGTIPTIAGVVSLALIAGGYFIRHRRPPA